MQRNHINVRYVGNHSKGAFFSKDMPCYIHHQHGNAQRVTKVSIDVTISSYIRKCVMSTPHWLTGYIYVTYVGNHLPDYTISIDILHYIRQCMNVQGVTKVSIGVTNSSYIRKCVMSTPHWLTGYIYVTYVGNHLPDYTISIDILHYIRQCMNVQGVLNVSCNLILYSNMRKRVSQGTLPLTRANTAIVCFCLLMIYVNTLQ